MFTNTDNIDHTIKNHNNNIMYSVLWIFGVFGECGGFSFKIITSLVK